MTKPDFTLYFKEGIEHFNARQFWHAHESWEALWLEADSDLVEFLQGLIQLAAAYHHVQRGTYSGAIRLFEAALRRMEPFPNPFCGIDRQPAVDAARRDRLALSGGGVPEEWNYPSLVLLSSELSPMPPRDDW